MVEEMYSIPASTWRKWRSQMDDLASAENHDARTSTIVMERVDELEALLQQHSPSVSPTTQHANDGDHPSQPTNTAQINHNAPTTCDASTQLYTIREASLSKHIFRRIRDNLTARRCAHLVGRLGAQVLTLTEDLLRVFSMTLTHTDSLYNLTVAARMLSAATGGVAEEPHIFCNSDEVEAQPSSSRNHDDGAAPGTSRYQAELEAIDHAAAKFAPYVYALQEDTLRALCSQLPSWRSIYVRSLEVEEAAQELYYARQGHLLNSFAEWIAAQPPIHVNESVQVDACEEKPIFMPFLCRNCRQDGRANYNYNAGKRRLSSVETAVAGAQFTGRSVETMTGSSAADPLGPQDSSRWHNRRTISYAAMPTEKPSPSGVSYAEEEKFRLARNPSSAQLERLAPNIRYLKGVLPSEKGGAPTGKSTGVGLPALPHHRQRLS